MNFAFDPDALRRLGELTLSTSDGTETVATEPAPPEAALPHRRLGDYELLEELGRGGMGIVYLARQAGLDRTVALKVISTHGEATMEAESRFRREAQNAARLRHPNIVTVYESGRAAGCSFFSMDHIQGGDLAERMRRAAFTPREAAAIMCKVASGVAHAHAAGVLHRDLKPSNILLDAGEPRIADFGLSTQLEPGGDLTVVTSVLGTPHYLAPEALLQGSAAMSESTDLYALGAILYELLTGRRPFAGATVGELAALVPHVEPPSPRLLNPLVERDLETICLKCLAKNPADRYVKVQGLVDDLGRWLVDEPIQARPPSALERFSRWCRRRPALAAAWFLLAALALVSALSAVVVARERAAATEQLRAALIAQTTATLATGAQGQRFQSLEALGRAARIRPGIDLRDAALRALALPDVRQRPELKVRYASNSAAAFTPNLTQVVVESGPGQLTLRQAEDGTELRSYLAPAGSPRAIYLAPIVGPGTHFAVRFADDRVRVYALDRPEPLWELTGRPVCQINELLAYDFSFTPDGKELAVGLPEGGVTLHDTATGVETARLDCGFVPAVVACSPDGRRVALAALRARRLEIYERPSGRFLRSLTHSGSVLHCAWRPDGTQVAAACFDSHVYLWDIASEQLPVILRGHRTAPSLLSWSPDNRWLASTARDQTIRLWDVQDGSAMLVIRGVTGEPCLRVAQDLRRLAHGSEHQSVGLFELSHDDVRREILRTAPGDYHNLRGCLDVSSDGRLYLTAARSGVRLFDAGRGVEVALLAESAGAERTARFTPSSDGLVISIHGAATTHRRLRWASAGELVVGPPEVIDSRPEFLVADVRGVPPQVLLLSESPTLASVRPLAGGTAVDFQLNGEPSAGSLSLDGKAVALADREGEVADAADAYVWEISPKRLLRRLQLGRNGSARFTPDGAWLWASGGEKAGFWSWPGLTPRYPGELSGYDGWQTRDGTLLAVADDDQLQLLRASDAALLGRLPSSTIVMAAFSNDGRELLQYVNFRTYAWDLPLLRRRLAEIGLDWDATPYGEAPAKPPAIRNVKVE